jgi:hypothetical protein
LQVIELNLDNCRATQIEGFTDEYTSLKLLSMINVGLTRSVDAGEQKNFTDVMSA